MQSKKRSILESIANTLVGLLVSFLIQLIVYPLMDIPVTLEKNVVITLIFFVASFLRSYILRRLFTKKII
jgi:hypothetical protein